ncbi:HAD family hydrolase [Candidatus Uhrbacteria bacterium]|nr:HAD family hydrolase [Candidatus Uhrbacteria bacterium]
MNKTIFPICIDLDHTLLDTVRIREDVYAHSRSYGVSRMRAKEAYRAAVAQRFTPSRYVSHLGLPRRESRALLAEITALVRSSDRYVFSGVRTFLSRARQFAPLYLVTHGDSSYQRVKLQQSGLAHYFSRVLVTPQITKEKMLRGLYAKSRGKILMIDDSRRVQQSEDRIGFPIIKVRKSHKDRIYFAKLYDETVAKYQMVLSSGSFPPNFIPKRR